MQVVVDQKPGQFVDRRSGGDRSGYEGRERRQFTDGRETAAPAVRELAEAVDSYKATHRRRFITYEELLGVIQKLGYSK